MEIIKMPQVSGYPRAKDKILTYIAENNPKELDRGKIASMLQISISTAGNYLNILANEYPLNLKYMRGTLIILSAFPDHAMPVAVRMELKQGKINKVKGMMKTLEENHLNHNDKEKIKEEVRKIRQELEYL